MKKYLYALGVSSCIFAACGGIPGEEDPHLQSQNNADDRVDSTMPVVPEGTCVSSQTICAIETSDETPSAIKRWVPFGLRTRGISSECMKLGGVYYNSEQACLAVTRKLPLCKSTAINIASPCDCVRRTNHIRCTYSLDYVVTSTVREGALTDELTAPGCTFVESFGYNWVSTANEPQDPWVEMAQAEQRCKTKAEAHLQ